MSHLDVCDTEFRIFSEFSTDEEVHNEEPSEAIQQICHFNGRVSRPNKLTAKQAGVLQCQSLYSESQGYIWKIVVWQLRTSTTWRLGLSIHANATWLTTSNSSSAATIALISKKNIRRTHTSVCLTWTHTVARLGAYDSPGTRCNRMKTLVHHTFALKIHHRSIFIM